METSIVRILALLWADILVGFALFVMQNYLTDVWKLSFTHAAAILNFWNGISMLLPVFFKFFVDELLGNFRMLMISSIAYSAGIGFVTMSIPIVLANSTGTCKQLEPQCVGHTQEALFYTGMVLIAVGMAGNLVSLKPFLKDQGLDLENIGASSDITCLQILGLLTVVIVAIVGAIALPYIKPWSLRFGIPAICTLVATILFPTGLCSILRFAQYNIVGPEGSPVTKICRVFVASVAKLCVPFPADDRLIYRRDGDPVKKFTRTRCLRCLHKAAIVREDIPLEEQERNEWTLCSVAEVQEAKIAVRMVPMWLTFIVCGIVSSIGNTYFVEQANHLNRHIGKWNVPLTSLLLFYKFVRSIFDARATKHLEEHKKHGPAVGIALAMLFATLCCITAARTEQRRLNAIRKHNLFDKPDEDIPMSIYWLFFQFFLLAGLDSLFEKSVGVFYTHQAPELMENYFVYLTKGVFGLGFMFSVLSVYVVGKISEKGGKANWFQSTLNKSRLDRYYWVLSVMSAVNLVVFGVVAWCYTYKEPASNRETVEAENGGADQGEAEERQVCHCCC